MQVICKQQTYIGKKYVKNVHTRLHCAGVKLGLSYLGDFYKPFSTSLGLRAKGHALYATRVIKRHCDIELLPQITCWAQ